MSMLAAMGLYSLSMAISPGPVNLIMFSAGTNFGFKKAMPFVTGASLGFILLLYIVGIGFYQVADKYPFFFDALSVIGSLFIAYIGIQLFQSRNPIEAKEVKRPTFLYGFLVQWLNPKAWVASIAGVAAFNLASSYQLLLTFIVIYFTICYLSISLWALLGSKVTVILKSQRQLTIFNAVMGASLLAIALYLLITHFYN